jgi:hypothetical protein
MMGYRSVKLLLRKLESGRLRLRPFALSRFGIDSLEIDLRRKVPDLRDAISGHFDQCDILHRALRGARSYHSRILNKHIVRIAGRINPDRRFARKLAYQGAACPASVGGDRVAGDKAPRDVRSLGNDRGPRENFRHGFLITACATAGVSREGSFDPADQIGRVDRSA